MNSGSFLEIALIGASAGLGVFCFILSRRLRQLNDLESGLGGAIAVMIAEVDRLERALHSARAEAAQVSKALAEGIETSRMEIEMWELRQKMGAARSALPQASRSQIRRRRREKEAVDA